MPVLFALLLFTLDLQAGEPLELIDAHSHHELEYASQFSCEDAINALDEAAVQRVLLTSRGNRSTLECYQRFPERVIPFYSVYQSPSDKSTWMNQPQVVDRAREVLERGNYLGIGELHIFEKDRQSEVLRGLVELARLHGLPLLLHADAAVIDEVFKTDPSARVLWAHLGTVPDTKLLQQMLDHYPEGLFIDTSVRDTWLLGNTTVNGPRRDKLQADWRDFFIRNQDRILVAVDTYSVNRWQRYAEVAAEIRLWLAQLPQPVAAKLSQVNAQNFFAGKP